jgi:hypothetical protein
VQVSAVPADRRDSATNHTLRSRDDAVDLIEDLQVAASRPLRQPNGKAEKQNAGQGAQDKKRSGKQRRSSGDKGGGEQR